MIDGADDDKDDETEDRRSAEGEDCLLASRKQAAEVSSLVAAILPSRLGSRLRSSALGPSKGAIAESW
jgi:hypothetical protein